MSSLETRQVGSWCFITDSVFTIDIHDFKSLLSLLRMNGGAALPAATHVVEGTRTSVSISTLLFPTAPLGPIISYSRQLGVEGFWEYCSHTTHMQKLSHMQAHKHTHSQWRAPISGCDSSGIVCVG